MKSLLIPSALFAAVLAPLWAAPAQAEPLPAEPATVFLKHHEEIQLAWTDTGLRLTSEGDEWSFVPVEALVDLGEYLIRHEDTGQCLTADFSGGEETVPVTLADCADALAWQAAFDDAPFHDDYRFAAPEGHFLGLEQDADVVEGAQVLAVLETTGSKHHQEWHLAVPDAPPSESPTPSLSAEAPTSAAAAQPQLPSTGTGLGAVAGAGAVALAGGAALLMWWQRRRALRTHW